MKLAPVVRAFSGQHGTQQFIIHTGQHYDKNMSNVFFRELDIPEPDINLGVGSGSHANQTAEIMTRIESVLMKAQPDWAFVYGDVNSTMAASLVCAKLQIDIAHVEAGLRSFDRTMPEEVNRLVTDRLANLLFTPSSDGDANLRAEGVDPQQIYCVGNVMIDTLIRLLPQTACRDILSRLQISNEEPYILVTLHRPSNVDNLQALKRLLGVLSEISRSVRVVFPIHPRTRNRIAEAGIDSIISSSLQIIDPVGYLDFLVLQKNAAAVVTDSGGIQEETTYLGVPCLTMRTNTERPITVTVGTNKLIGCDTDRLYDEVGQILNGNGKTGRIPDLWDGQAADRIVNVVLKKYYRQ